MANLTLRALDDKGVCSEFPHAEGVDYRGAGNTTAPTLVLSTYGSRERRRFRLSWDNATEGQVYRLRTLFRQAGTVRAMNYYPPDGGGLVEVRFVQPLEITQNSTTDYSVEFDVEEVLR